MRSIPAMQVLWLVVYWWGVLPALYLFGVALVGSVSLDKVSTLVLALVGSLLGAAWATRIARRHVGSTAFIKGTTTVRVIAIAWLAIGAVIIIGTFTSVVLGVDFGKSGEALGIVSTVGSVSLLAMLGPGYAEYRSVAKPDEDSRPTPPAPAGA